MHCKALTATADCNDADEECDWLNCFDRCVSDKQKVRDDRFKMGDLKLLAAIQTLLSVKIHGADTRIKLCTIFFQAGDSLKLRKPMITRYGQAAMKGQAGAEDHLSRRGTFSIRALN